VGHPVHLDSAKAERGVREHARRILGKSLGARRGVEGVCPPPSKQGPCRMLGAMQEVLLLPPLPNPTCLGAGQPAWAPMPRKLWASVPLGWLPRCCGGASRMRS